MSDDTPTGGSRWALAAAVVLLLLVLLALLRLVLDPSGDGTHDVDGRAVLPDAAATEDPATDGNAGATTTKRRPPPRIPRDHVAVPPRRTGDERRETLEQPGGETGSAPATPTVPIGGSDRGAPPPDGYTAHLVRPDDLTDRAAFGSAVAIDGGVAAISAVRLKNGAGGTGRVYVFERGDAGWALATSLRSPRIETRIVFGASVAVSGGRIAVSDLGEFENEPVVRVYRRDEVGGSWSQEEELAVPSGEFARSLAINGDTLLVGAHEDSHVFEHRMGAWSHVHTIEAPAGRVVGHRVALSGDRAAVWLLPVGDDGAILVYRCRSGNWTVEATLVDRQLEGHSLGESLALHGSTVVAGRWSMARGLTVFTEDEGDWRATARLAVKGWQGRPSPGGNGVAFDGDRIASSLLGSADGRRPGLLVARYDGADWALGAVVPPPDERKKAGFWYVDTTVAISGDTLLVGNHERHRRGRALFVTLGADFPVPRPTKDRRKRGSAMD